MNKPRVGYDEQYSKNYDAIFKKSQITWHQKIENWFISLFIIEDKNEPTAK